MLEERLYATDCMINGWILTGFPKTSSQMNYIFNHNHRQFKPSLAVIIEVEDEFILKKASNRKIDPTTGG